MPILAKLLRLDPKIQVSLILGLIWLVAIFHFRTFPVIFSPFISLVACVVTDFFWNLFFKKAKFFSTSALVSGLLVGLILSFATPWPMVLATAVLTIILKQLLKYHGRVIFNPAALGLLISAVLLHTQIAWWALSWNTWLILPLIIAQGYILKRLKRLWLPVFFLLSYTLYLYIKLPGNILPLLIDGTVIFFAMIMLPEPQSTPAINRWQYFFGPLLVVNIFILSFLPSWDLDPLLSGLIITNIESFFWRKLKHEI